MHYTYKTHGTCSARIDFDLNSDHTVSGVSFLGGCDGNLKAVSKLVDGMTAERLVSLLLGNTCGRKNTSCADQLARAVREALEQSE